MSAKRFTKYRSWKSLPAAESHCLHPVLRFPSLNSERCRSSLDRPTDGNCFIVGEFVRRPVAARRRTRRTRPLIVTGNGRYPPKVRFWAEGNRSKKNPHPVPPSRRTTSRAGSQTEAENLGMIMPPRGRRHLLRRLDYVPQKETIFSGLLALSPRCVGRSIGLENGTSKSEEYQVTFLSGHLIVMLSFFRRCKCDSPHVNFPCCRVIAISGNL